MSPLTAAADPGRSAAVAAAVGFLVIGSFQAALALGALSVEPPGVGPEPTC